MKFFRASYDKLPANTRSAFRALIPASLRRRYAHKKTDVYLLSYPKCGRTWLRLMLGRAIACHFNLPLDEDHLLLNWKTKPHPQVPMITVIHDDRPQFKAPEELQTSKDMYRDKRVIFLVRDPRDVIVSSYFEMNKRGHLFGENPYEGRKTIFEGGLPEFVEKREGGFDTILAYYNIWARNRQVPRGFLLVRYEDLQVDAPAELRRVLDFLGLQEISEETVREAVAYASFENMRKIETEGKFQSGALKPGDQDDQESYKTRQGKIGSHAEHLSAGEIEKLNQKMRQTLSDIYGYQP